MKYINKSNQQGLEDLHWLIADDKKESGFYRRIAQEVLTAPVPLAGGGSTTLGTKVTWQANEFMQIKTLINRNHALLSVLAGALSALAESSNADAEEVKALIAKKMDEATEVLKAELDEIQADGKLEVATMTVETLSLPETEFEELEAPVAVVVDGEVPEEGPGLEKESVPEEPKVEAQPSNTAPNAAPVSNV